MLGVNQTFGAVATSEKSGAANAGKSAVGISIMVSSHADKRQSSRTWKGHGVFGISGMAPVPGTPEVTPPALGSEDVTPLIALLAAQEVKISLAC
jgi:hypothetical protein